MADRAKRLSTNVDGNFFVDSTCINCDTCRQLAPTSFVENGDSSSVFCQPESETERYQAYQALLACPVGSIGAIVPDKGYMRAATDSFPMLLEHNVYYNGFNSEKSYGANSYFIRHPGGNWLIDSPRYMKRLEDFFERMGGISHIFLTHEDDIGDAPRYAKRFGAKRIIHRADADAQPDAEWIVDGLDPVAAAGGFTIVPVPGHTDGSMALLFNHRYLFTGDHMSWDREINGLRLATVYVWDEETLRRSAAKLVEFPFEWVLPGHGDRIHLPSARMKEELRLLLARRAEKVPIP
ncbi:MAG: MBL fold metallo-hydrolase [Nitrospirae bacterium]|nr:MAG: MBL fold metallo-hydrolase [Nitrospirota bacterium]